jgi:hypothetical protein
MSMRWGVLATIPLTFWVTLALMPPELAQIDEKHVLWQASSYGAIEIARNLMRDSHPPLYYWLVHLWWEIGGFDRPYAYRVLSILLGLTALPLAFQLGKQTAGPRIGMWTVILIALNPFYIFQLFLIRMYGGVIALGAASTWVWLLLLQRPSTRRWLAWMILQGILLFTHYYSVLLLLCQIVILGLHRPRGWQIGLMISTLLWGAFGLWLLQAYAGSMENTVRNLSAIPVRPRPWEVLEHFWASWLTGPLSDGHFARAAGLATALGALAVWICKGLRKRTPLPVQWQLIGMVSWLPLAMGAGIALRWPFFGARYFAMVLIPFLVWVITPIALRARWFVITFLVPGLISLPAMPLIQSFPDAGDTKEIAAMQILGDEDPILIQAWWHSLWPEYPRFRSYDWNDPRQRAIVLSQHPSFWFIGVTLYRGNWEGWVTDLQRTHTVDFYTEIDHFVPERRATVIHFTRKAQPVRWDPYTVRWENGLQLQAIGRIDESAKPGHPLRIALRMSTDRPLTSRWTLFLHLVDEHGQLWSNWDAEPEPGVQHWAPGQTIEVHRSLLIPLYTPPGRYRLQIGWYPTGAPGFPRLPLEGGASNSLIIGEIEVHPRVDPARVGSLSAGPVEVEPPVARMVQGIDGWRLEVQVRWRSRSYARISGWQVMLRTPDGSTPLQRAYRIPDATVVTPGWLTEIWISPPLSGTRPALSVLEILYEGHRIIERPVWIFPADTGWVYGWVFLNRFPR